jgi:Domain of unknown function (DUF4124)
MKKRTAAYVLVVLIVAAFSNVAVAAGLYKWVDKDGKVNYSTSPPEADDAVDTSPPSAGNAPRPQASNNTSAHVNRKAPRAAHSSQDTISLNFNEVDLARVFAIFADFSRNRLSIDPSIHRTIAVHYFDVEWEPTMREIAARYGLVAKVENGTIYIKKNGSR